MKIQITLRADRGRSKVLSYLERMFSIRKADEIDDRINACLRSITKLPFQWPEIISKKYGPSRKAIIDSKTIIIYRLLGDKIEVLDIFDARTNWK